MCVPFFLRPNKCEDGDVGMLLLEVNEIMTAWLWRRVQELEWLFLVL